MGWARLAAGPAFTRIPGRRQEADNGTATLDVS